MVRTMNGLCQWERMGEQTNVTHIYVDIGRFVCWVGVILTVEFALRKQHLSRIRFEIAIIDNNLWYVSISNIQQNSYHTLQATTTEWMHANQIQLTHSTVVHIYCCNIVVKSSDHNSSLPLFFCAIGVAFVAITSIWRPIKLFRFIYEMNRVTCVCVHRALSLIEWVQQRCKRY